MPREPRNKLRFIQIATAQGRLRVEVFGLTSEGEVYLYRRGLDDGWKKLVEHEIKHNQDKDVSAEG